MASEERSAGSFKLSTEHSQITDYVPANLTGQACVILINRRENAENYISSLSLTVDILYLWSAISSICQAKLSISINPQVVPVWSVVKGCNKY